MTVFGPTDEKNIIEIAMLSSYTVLAVSIRAVGELEDRSKLIR